MNREEKNRINGQVYTLIANGNILSIFVAKGEPYEDKLEEIRVDYYFCLQLTCDLMQPKAIRNQGNEKGFKLKFCRPATQAEMDLLTKTLYEHDLVWNAEKEELVKRSEIKEWKPEDGELCWICYYYNMESGFIPMLFEDGNAYPEAIKRGWVFQTKRHCQYMCDKLNQAVLQTSINSLQKFGKEK